MAKWHVGALVLAVMIALAGTTPSDRVQAVGVGFGDANCSGNIDSIDALVVLQYAAALSGYTRCLNNADVNGDHDVTSVDATLILQFQARLLDRLGPAAGTVAATAVAAGDRHTCAVTVGGGVKCWGTNVSGALGDGTTTDHIWAHDVPALSIGVTAITAGLDDTCVLTTKGGVKCWGFNDQGELGDGTFSDRYSPVDVSGLTNGVVAIAARQAHSCAITDNGGLMCWGSNFAGELGGPTSQTCTEFNFPCSSVPIRVTGLDSGIAEIALGDQHSCALTTAGGVKCWGRNEMGQLGDGTTTDRSTPVDVMGLTTGVQAIVAGVRHTCAVTTLGGVECWGWNAYAQLGFQTTETCGAAVAQSDPCSTTPADVTDLSSGVAALASGYDHTCAQTTVGVKCWGSAGFGELGAHATETCANDVPCSRTPLAVTGLDHNVMTITGGGYHTCAIVGNGALKCWGLNNSGELGAKSPDCNNPYPCSFTPTDVIGFAATP